MAASTSVDSDTEPREAAESVKTTAQEGVENVKQEGQSAAADVKDQAQASKETGAAATVELNSKPVVDSLQY